MSIREMSHATCPSCGKHYIRHMGLTGLCEDNGRLTRKLLHIGGMCGAVRDPNDILRDIAKMCSEELE